MYCLDLLLPIEMLFLASKKTAENPIINTRIEENPWLVPPLNSH